MPEDSGKVAELLQQWVEGDKDALGQVVPVVYQELRRLAHFQLKTERADHVLQSTALVNEAFLRLLGGQPVELRNRSHFVAVAARLMRQVLMEYGRRRRANKRDGGYRISFEHILDLPINNDAELEALDHALDGLARADERQAQVVEMKFFGGLAEPEVAEVLGISLATVERDWRTARIWLRREMKKGATL
jgi:RNA polymerase sigma factor (TIGR02999 family)